MTTEQNAFGYYIYQAAARGSYEENKPSVVFLPDGTMWFPHVIVAGSRPDIYVIREIDGEISPDTVSATSVNPGGTSPHIIYETTANDLLMAFEYNEKIYYRTFDSSFFTGALGGASEDVPRPLVDCIQVDDGGDSSATTNWSIKYNVLAAPTNLHGTTFDELGGTFTLEWTAVSSEILAGYNLYYGDPKVKINGALIVGTTYPLAPLSFNIPYYVTAVSTFGVESTYSTAYIPTELEAQSYKLVNDGQLHVSLGELIYNRYISYTDAEKVRINDGAIHTIITTIGKIYLHQTDTESVKVNDGKSHVLLTGIGSIEI